MATYVLRPNANWNNEIGFTATSSSYLYTALSDNSDSSYIRRTSTTIPTFYELEFDTTALGLGEVITSVNIRVRYEMVGGDLSFYLGVIGDRNGRTVSYGIPITKINTQAIKTYDLAMNMTTSPSGAPWTQTLLDNLVLKITDNAGTTGARAKFYEVYADINTTTKPTVTVTAPSGTVSTTSFPSINWNYADAEGDEQAAYQVKIIPQTVYSFSSFNPESALASVDTGVVASTNNGAILEVDLANSTTYRAYVKVAQVVNGEYYFSDWAYSQFVLSIEAPATPLLSAYYDAAEKAIAITVFGRTNFLSANQASLETNTDGWILSSNCAVTRTDSQASDGTASLQLTANASGDMIASTTDATKFAILPSVKFTAIAYFRTAATARSVFVGIRYLASDSSTISTTYGAAVIDSTTTFTAASVTVTAPANATFAQVFIKIVAAASSEIHYVDKIALHAGDIAVWTKGGFSNFSFDVERSSDLGVTWSAVRNSPIVAQTAQVAVLNDYESPFDTSVLYRAKAKAEL